MPLLMRSVGILSFKYLLTVVTSLDYVQERESSNALAVFATPFTTLYNIVFQTAGEVNGNNIIHSSLHYEAATYVLLFIFVIAVPILFNNFLASYLELSWL